MKSNKEIVFVLYNQGLSYNDIAEKTNIPLKKTRYILQRGMIKGEINKRTKFVAQTKKGSKHNRAKYPESEIVKACELLKNGYKLIQVAELVKIHYDTIRRIKAKKVWRSVSKFYF